MRIGELARRARLPAARVRFYEARGLIPKVERQGTGYRNYPDGAITTLRLISAAQALGFSLTEIRAGLMESGGNLPSISRMLDALRSKLSSLDANIDYLNRRRTKMATLIERLQEEGALLEMSLLGAVA